MTTIITAREKILDVLEKILKDKEYKDEYPKIVLRCPATEDGEHKLHNALYNVDYVINSYFPKLAEKYEVAGTTNGAIDEPSDVIDFDDCSDGVFYADVVNASDFDGEYVIGGNYYSSIEEVNNSDVHMSAKNSLIIDVDIFNTICDELYTEALYNKTIDKLFNTDNYEYSFSADAKIVKSVCDKVNDYINNNGSVVGTIDKSKIKTDELDKYPDETTIDVTFYIEEQTIDDIKILNYYCKFKKYDWRETLESYFEEKEKQEKEGNNNMKKNNKKAEREIILIDTEFLDNTLEAGNETIAVDEIRKIAEDHMPDGSGVLIKEAYSNNTVEELVKMINNGVDAEPTSPAPTNVMLPEIDRIYYNKTKKTVNIYWANGAETKAITAEGDKFSLTAGIKECFIKYACGNSFDKVQARLQDAMKKAVLTASKEKKNKKSKVERLVEEVANANLTSDEKDDFVIALDKVINTETIKPVKQNKKGSK